MADPYPIASELSYFVSQKQRREVQSPGLGAHESRQQTQANSAVIVGRRLESLREQLIGEYAPLDGESRRHG